MQEKGGAFLCTLELELYKQYRFVCVTGRTSEPINVLLNDHENKYLKLKSKCIDWETFVKFCERLYFSVYVQKDIEHSFKWMLV